MRVTILNGEPDPGSAFEAYLAVVAARLAERGHSLVHLALRDLDLKGCSGCWSCWVKTPGTCARQDDSERVRREVMAADLLLAASPVRLGFTSSLLKRAADQMIPLVHPHLVMEGGEMHHRRRYARYPRFALLLGPGADADAEDLALTEAMWRRTARNLKFPFQFAAVADRPAEEVADGLVASA
jgi:multimeric flavodoxin WrbA